MFTCLWLNIAKSTFPESKCTDNASVGNKVLWHSQLSVTRGVWFCRICCRFWVFECVSSLKSCQESPGFGAGPHSCCSLEVPPESPPSVREHTIAKTHNNPPCAKKIHMKPAAARGLLGNPSNKGWSENDCEGLKVGPNLFDNQGPSVYYNLIKPEIVL